MGELQGNNMALLSVFISYVHEDEQMYQQLEVHRSLLQRQGWIATWHSGQLLAGTEMSFFSKATILVVVVLTSISFFLAFPIQSAYAATASLFTDDFQDSSYTASAWTNSTTLAATDASNRQWSVITDPADASNKILSQGKTGINNEAYAIAGDLSWTDYSYEANVKLMDTEPYPGLLARYTDSNNYYMCRLDKVGDAKLEISKKVNGSSTVLGSFPFTPKTNTWYPLGITVQGSTIRCSLNGVISLEVTDTALTAGKIGFRTNWGMAGFDDVVVNGLTSPAPAAPTGLAASSITDTSVSLTWNTVPEATVYRLYRSSSTTGIFQSIYEGTGASYQDVGLTKGTTYYYKVTYETSDGVESASSPALSATTTIPAPGVPMGLSVAMINSHSAQFRWSQATDAASYKLYRALQPGGPYTPVNPVNQNLYISTNGVDCQLTPETTYYYAVSAVNPAGESAKSTEIKITTPKPEDDLIQNAGFWCPNNSASVIQGHGGYILQVGDTYYWYGEDKSQNNASFLNVAAYASKDLVHWSFRNNILTVNSAPELSDAKIERPKVLYNAATHKYVMWGHKEPAANYNEAKVAVAVSDTPDGNFTYLGSFDPLGDQSRDFTLFQDDDGTAYLISSANNNLDLNVCEAPPRKRGGFSRNFRPLKAPSEP